VSYSRLNVDAILIGIVLVVFLAGMFSGFVICYVAGKI